MRVWVDIDNAPHVQIFRPIISRLTAAGATVEVTARARTFVPELLSAARIGHTVIGRGQPTGAASKVWAIASRTLALAGFAKGRGFNVAVGHGSRSLPLAARLTRVPNLTMFDYEHVSTWIFRKFCDRILVPRAVSEGMAGFPPRASWRTFEGFKEEIYLAGFRPDPSIRVSLGVRENEILAVLRPPSRTAHYHDQRSATILESVMRRLVGSPGLRSVWLKRGQEDEPPVWVRGRENVLIPDRPVDGLSLLAAADIAISGGGTMNREAALLGTPAYSIFTGRPGAVDEELIRRGLLHVVATPADVDRIPIERKRPTVEFKLNSDLCHFVIDQIEEIAWQGSATGR